MPDRTEQPPYLAIFLLVAAIAPACFLLAQVIVWLLGAMWPVLIVGGALLILWTALLFVGLLVAD